MRFAVIGAGSIGGFLGARLALAGETVTFVARGATLEALRAGGLRLIEADGETRTVQNAGFEAIDTCPTHEVVLLAVKAHQAPAIAEAAARLLAPGGTLVTLQNGVPWWYCHGIGGEFEGRPIRSADPEGRLAAAIDPAAIVGSVVYPAAELEAPGVVRVVEGNRFTLGEPDGSRSERVEAISQALTRAGFKAPVSVAIRDEIWLKLWGNIVFNPVSALSHATLEDICAFEPTRALAAEMMAEAQLVAERLGARLRVSIERRIAGAAAIGAHKTSMLQDVEHGREIELEALVGGVVELARMTGIATPHIDAVYAVTGLLARSLAAAGSGLALPRPK